MQPPRAYQHRPAARGRGPRTPSQRSLTHCPPLPGTATLDFFLGRFVSFCVSSSVVGRNHSRAVRGSACPACLCWRTRLPVRFCFVRDATRQVHRQTTAAAPNEYLHRLYWPPHVITDLGPVDGILLSCLVPVGGSNASYSPPNTRPS